MKRVDTGSYRAKHCKRIATRSTIPNAFSKCQSLWETKKERGREWFAQLPSQHFSGIMKRSVLWRFLMWFFGVLPESIGNEVLRMNSEVWFSTRYSLWSTISQTQNRKSIWLLSSRGQMKIEISANRTVRWDACHFYWSQIEVRDNHGRLQSHDKMSLMHSPLTNVMSASEHTHTHGKKADSWRNVEPIYSLHTDGRIFHPVERPEGDTMLLLHLNIYFEMKLCVSLCDMWNDCDCHSATHNCVWHSMETSIKWK